MPSSIRLRAQDDIDADGIVTAGDDTEHSLGRCRAVDCRNRCAVVTSGFQVPVCVKHWGALSRASRLALCAVAPASPFDVDAASRAARALRNAQRELAGRRS